MVPETYLVAVEEGGGIPLHAAPAAVRRRGDRPGARRDRRPGRLGRRRRRPGALRRRARSAHRRARGTTATRGRPRSCSARSSGACRCSRSAAARSCSTSRSAARCVQHVPDVCDADHGRAPGGFARTDVEITGGTLVRDVLGSVGDRLSVHCHHHQVLDRVADGLVVSAHAGDGLIEAVELPSAPFVVGVQWHPEQHESDRRLFRALAQACRGEAALDAGGPNDASSGNARGSSMSEAFAIVDPSTGEAFTEVGLADAGGGRPGRAPRRARAGGLGGARPRRPRPPPPPRSPPPSTRTRTSWRTWRCATPATRSPPRAGRPDTSATCSSTTRAHRNA